MRRCLGIMAILCVLGSGCLSPEARMQVAEESEKKNDLDITLVRDVADVASAGPMKVQGVGLVTGLAGTGHSPRGYYRTLLEQHLLKNIGSRNGEIANEEHHLKVRQILDDANNALVIVTGYIDVGSRRGECFDVQVTLPRESKTTSLAGGYLHQSLLRVYEAKSTLSQDPKFAKSSELVASQIFGQAKGPLIVGFGANTDPHDLKSGIVWQGGMSRIDRPYSFLLKMNEKERSIKATNALAQRLNFLYQDDPHRPLLNEQQRYHMLMVNNITDQLNQRGNMTGLLQTEMAKALDKNSLNVRVPFAYRHDHERYLRVAMLTPIEAEQNMTRYIQRLGKMLLNPDPRSTMPAALRLEAMGSESIPILKSGLESEHTLVRFCSAESLTYLGSTSGAETLAQVARENPRLAYHACIALANLGENICRDKLSELLTSPDSAVHVSAFHALCLDEKTDPTQEPRLNGIHLNDTFWLHRFPTSPTRNVYFSTSQRAQVILFGRDIVLEPDTRLIVGKDYTVVTSERDDTCVVKMITTQGEKQKTCTSRVDEILVALSYLDASYPDIVDFLKKAHDHRKINCPATAWTLPVVSFDALVDAGRSLK